MLSLADYSYEIDMWSTGCVFGEMLLGKVMFKGENDLDQLNVICSSFGLKIESFYNQETSFPEHWFDGLPPEGKFCFQILFSFVSSTVSYIYKADP